MHLGFPHLQLACSPRPTPAARAAMATSPLARSSQADVLTRVALQGDVPARVALQAAFPSLVASQLASLAASLVPALRAAPPALRVCFAARECGAWEWSRLGFLWNFMYGPAVIGTEAIGPSLYGLRGSRTLPAWTDKSVNSACSVNNTLKTELTTVNRILQIHQPN